MENTYEVLKNHLSGMANACFAPCEDDPHNMNELRLEEAIHCNCFKSSELMKRDKTLPECNQCVNLNCAIGVHNYLALYDLVKIKDTEGGGVK